ncbi:MAG TPA: hypothetical protein VFF06_00950 [Polyangia bacterium]|nr:hypothetical protein [Polyangia bacterium]
MIPSRAAAEFRRLPHPARNILKLCDGVRPREAIFASSPLPAETTEQVLRRLLALGVLSLRGGARPSPPLAIAPASAPALAPSPSPSPPAPSDFSDDEERFFASSIEHLIEND